MAKKTLLEIVQDILSDMESDEVNSISDTVEAEEVARIVKASYEAMLSNRNWPHTARILELTPYSDSDFPTHMYLPENVKELISVYYNKAKSGDTRLKYSEVKWREPDDFLRLINNRNSDSPNCEIITDTSGVKLLILNNASPNYFTSFDDNTMIFDSYDSEVDSTLQASKVQARGYIMPEFVLADDTIPDLPVEAFTALIEEAKSRAMLRLKQTSDPKAEQEAVRQQAWLANRAWRVKGGIGLPNYGRNSKRYSPRLNLKDPR